IGVILKKRSRSRNKSKAKCVSRSRSGHRKGSNGSSSSSRRSRSRSRSQKKKSIFSRRPPSVPAKKDVEPRKSVADVPKMCSTRSSKDESSTTAPGSKTAATALPATSR
ncbi:unnamed protein product, partial [Amoebophrya sp. A120]